MAFIKEINSNCRNNINDYIYSNITYLYFYIQKGIEDFSEKIFQLITICKKLITSIE